MNPFRAGVPLLLFAILFMACNDETPMSPDPTRGEATTGIAKNNISTEAALRFQAMLSGAENVPPTPSQGTGVAKFRLSDDGLSIAFKLQVRNLSDITFAHIHLGAFGTNGEAVVFLYDGPTIPGPFSGTLAQGTITAEDLIGSLAGQPLSALVAEMNTEGTYINVHTMAFPSGEIRGQVVPI